VSLGQPFGMERCSGICGLKPKETGRPKRNLSLIDDDQNRKFRQIAGVKCVGISMRQKQTATTLLLLLVLACTYPLLAQNTTQVQYVYDALGRLTQVIDPSGNVATYNYDAVGNLLSITRSTNSPSALAVFGFSPAQGSVGQTVVIQGQNFSATPSANAVQFNGTAATVNLSMIILSGLDRVE